MLYVSGQAPHSQVYCSKHHPSPWLKTRPHVSLERSHRIMAHTPLSDSTGQSERRDGHRAAKEGARQGSLLPKQDRLRRALSLGIPAVTVAVLGIYVLVWWVNNANPALQARPADPQVVQQVTGVPEALWQRVGTGGLSNPWHPIRGQPALTGQNGHPEFFYVGGEFCEFCATERWAILNALSRFGAFSHVSQLRSFDEQIATFSFYQSSYTSPYVDFVPIEHVGNTKDLLGQFVSLQPFQGKEQQLFNRYASTTYLPTGQGLPFIDLNNQDLLGGGLDPAIFQNTSHEPLSWQEIARALTTPASPLAQQILGTANYLTAAICLVTYQQPGRVCHALAIQQIEAALGIPSSSMPTTPWSFLPPDLLTPQSRSIASRARGFGEGGIT